MLPLLQDARAWIPRQNVAKDSFVHWWRSARSLGVRVSDTCIEQRHFRVAFSPDGRFLVSLDQADQLRVDLERTMLDRLLKDPSLGLSHTDAIDHVEFHPGGSLIVSGSSDNSVKVWDLASDSLILSFPVFSDTLVFPRFSLDGRLLAVATSEGTTLYDFLGQEVLTTKGSMVARSQDFTFLASQDPRTPALAMASRESPPGSPVYHTDIGFWSLEPYQPLRFHRYSAAFLRERLEPSIAVIPSGSLVALNEQKLLVIHDFLRDRDVRVAIEQNPRALAFSPSGDRLWGVLDETSIVSWSAPRFEQETIWEDPQRDQLPGRVGITCLAAGAGRITAGARSSRVYLLRPGDGQLENVMVASGPVQSIALSPDETIVACGLLKGGFSLFQLPRGEQVVEIPAHPDTVSSLAFHPVGNTLATASRDKTIALWRLAGIQTEELLRITSPSNRPVLGVRFSPDGKTLGALIQDERAVRLWKLDLLRDKLADLGLDWPR